jgi:hypothetical protein
MRMYRGQRNQSMPFAIIPSLMTGVFTRNYGK